MGNTKANAQLFGSEEVNWNRVFKELNKINDRLTAIEKPDSGTTGSQLEGVLREIEEIKQTIPQLQRVVELNKYETLSGLEKTNSKLSDLEGVIKNQVLEKLSQPNKSLGDVIDQINAQNKRLEDTNSIFRSELIPTINKEFTTNRTKVDLASEKLSRLIEILKTIVKEQAKLDPVATALSAIQKEQKALQKAQAGFIKDQAAIKEALADLRRKANVNISRSDDIKKTLGQLKK